MRVEAFARALMRGAARNATSTHGVQRGAFNAETYLLSSERMDARPAFEGKITYPPCKYVTPVHTRARASRARSRSTLLRARVRAWTMHC